MAKKRSKKTIEMLGDWEPYKKFKPYWQIKCALIMFLALFLPFLWSIGNDILEGNVSCEGTACGNPIIDGGFQLVIIGGLLGVLSGLWGPGLIHNLQCYRHPGWVWPTCPVCGYRGFKGENEEGYAENWFLFLWNRVLPATCPKCKLEFEIDNMAQWGWLYDDEPVAGEKYGDSSKIRVRPNVPLRFLSFVIKKNDTFGSNHYELIKVVPIVATVIGIFWFIGILDVLLLLTILTCAMFVFIWDHVLFQPIKEIYDEALEEIFSIEEEYVFLPNTLIRKVAVAATFVITCILALLFLPGGVISNHDNPWIRKIGEIIWEILIIILKIITGHDD